MDCEHYLNPDNSRVGCSDARIWASFRASSNPAPCDALFKYASDAGLCLLPGGKPIFTVSRHQFVNYLGWMCHLTQKSRFTARKARRGLEVRGQRSEDTRLRHGYSTARKTEVFDCFCLVPCALCLAPYFVEGVKKERKKG